MAMSHVIYLLFIAASLSTSDAAVGRAVVDAGKPYSVPFGEGHYIVQRVTNAANGSQYMFAGTDYWSATNGEVVARGTSRLLWNGTLVFDNVTQDDAGGYSLPLEKERITCPNGPMEGLPTSLYIFSIKGTE